LKRRILAIGLAIVLAILGTTGVLAYVHKADARAVAGMKAVSVLVAQQQVASGTSASTALQNGSLTSQKLPASSVPSDAVRSITPGLGSLVLSATLQPGQLLLRPMLVTAAQATASGALQIPKGMIAVTVPLCVEAAVAGYVQPGSQVAVFDTYPTKKATLQEQCSQSGQSHQAQGPGGVVTRIVLPRVLVLAIGTAGAGGTTSGATSTAASGGSLAHGSQTDPAGSVPNGAVLVTLAVSQPDAERLILITEAGLPYMALLTPYSQTGHEICCQQLFQP